MPRESQQKFPYQHLFARATVPKDYFNCFFGFCLSVHLVLSGPHQPSHLSSRRHRLDMAARDATRLSFTSRLPFFGGRKANASAGDSNETESDEPASNAPPKWSFGVLNDKKTIEVPGEKHSQSARQVLEAQSQSEQPPVLTAFHTRLRTAACGSQKRAAGPTQCSGPDVPLLLPHRQLPRGVPAGRRQKEDDGRQDYPRAAARGRAQRPA